MNFMNNIFNLRDTEVVISLILVLLKRVDHAYSKPTSIYITHTGTVVDRNFMVVRFTTTCAISGYHHKSFKLESRSWRDVLDTTLCNEFCQ